MQTLSTNGLMILINIWCKEHHQEIIDVEFGGSYETGKTDKQKGIG